MPELLPNRLAEIREALSYSARFPAPDVAFLLSRIDKLTVERDAAREQAAQVGTLRGLVADFLDEDECEHDEQGCCLPHGWSEADVPCPYTRARALLAEQPQGGGDDG